MSFKDQVEKDIKAVFINPLEFADMHNINGVNMLCVVDKDQFIERTTPSYAEYAEGVFKDLLHIYVDIKDMARRPVKGEVLRLDGEIYLVQSVFEDMGMYEITVEANET